jgi:hypothetical protein
LDRLRQSWHACPVPAMIERTRTPDRPE